ncbi:cationic amino acid transporter 3 [Bubalus bubalis]|uniref:cationic amino acid transporter 3 n=1 Tax=Bubalus bubalis TaxID=89462 RepID=UPI001E1B95B9|nr:cationic amino acid transporter 3 [Bubalus bubalis]
MCLPACLLSSTLTLAVLLLTILSLILGQWPSQVFSGDPVLTTVAVLLLLLITGVTAVIWRQPQDPTTLHFSDLPYTLDMGSDTTWRRTLSNTPASTSQLLDKNIPGAESS